MKANFSGFKFSKMNHCVGAPPISVGPRGPRLTNGVFLEVHLGACQRAGVDCEFAAQDDGECQVTGGPTHIQVEVLCGLLQIGGALHQPRNCVYMNLRAIEPSRPKVIFALTKEGKKVWNVQSIAIDC
jgi:hypothetical protein